MKKPFALYIAVISICLIGSLKFGNACGPSLAVDEVRMAVFSNAWDEHHTMSPFYYSENYLNHYDADPAGVDYQRNCQEWVSFGNNAFSEKDVYLLQYETDSEQFFKFLENPGDNDILKNAHTTWLLMKENKDALEYMKIAKKIEETQFGDDDPWREHASTNQSSMIELQEEVLNKLKTEKNEFLKQRYAFQAVKLGHYCQEQKPEKAGEAQKIFHDIIAKSNSVILGWSQMYVGLMQESNSERVRYLIRAYENSEQKKIFCYQNISRASLDSVITNTTDSKEKETALAIRSSKNFGRGLTQLKEITAINPNSKYIPFLLTREINKLENWIWTNKVAGFETYSPEALEEYTFEYDTPQNDIDKFVAKNLQKDLHYAVEVRTFLENSLLTAKNNNDFVKLSIAHLYNLKSEHEKALEICETIAKQKQPQLEKQRNIETLISIAYSKDVTEEANKQLILPYIKQLGQSDYWNTHSQNEDYGDQYDQWRAYSFEKSQWSNGTLLLLSKRYQTLGDIVTAGLLRSKSNSPVNQYIGWSWEDTDSNSVNYKQFGYFDKYADTGDIDNLIKLKHKKNKTAFEQFISLGTWAKDDTYRDLKGTIYLRRRNYRKAMEEFAKISPDFWQTNYEYAEYLPTQSITSMNSVASWDNTVGKNFTLVSKYELIKELVEKQDSTQMSGISNENRARLYCEIGNAQFNMTRQGNAWMMMSYGKNINELTDERSWSYAYYDFYPQSIKCGKDYYKCQAAIESYNKALEYAKKDETKARCYIALIMCEMNATNDISNPKSNQYRKLLNKKFDNTEVYQKAYHSCSYYY